MSPKPRTRGPAQTETRLRILIEEATVDCYNEAEELTGLLTVIQEHLQVPFETTVLGATVTVERVDFNEADEIVAFCRRGRERQRIPVVDLPLPSPHIAAGGAVHNGQRGIHPAPNMTARRRGVD